MEAKELAEKRWRRWTFVGSVEWGVGCVVRPSHQTKPDQSTLYRTSGYP